MLAAERTVVWGTWRPHPACCAQEPGPVLDRTAGKSEGLQPPPGSLTDGHAERWGRTWRERLRRGGRACMRV